MRPLLEDPVPFTARRSMAAAAFDDRLYLLGGVGALTGRDSILDVSDDLWCFDPGDLIWTRIAAGGPGPEPRRCPGWVGTPEGVSLWGGSGLAGAGARRRHTFLNDRWLLRPDRGTWEAIEESEDAAQAPEADAEIRRRPGPRYTPVLEVAVGGLVLFGGYTEDRVGGRMLNDAWRLTAGGWERLPAAEPAGYAPGARWPGIRYGCMAASDGEDVYVCGGASPATDHADLWRLDAKAGRFELLAGERGPGPGPTPRYCAAMTVHRGRIFLFGGRSRWNPKLDYNDLWAFDLGDRRWECLQDNELPHRYDASADRPGYHAKAAVARVGSHLYVLAGEGWRGHVSDFWRLDLEACRWELIQAARSDDPVLW